jgi:hypothetical protein
MVKMQMLVHALFQPLRVTRALPSILEDARFFERNEAALHHFVQDREEGFDLSLGVSDFDNDRTVIGAKSMPRMHQAGLPESDRTF